MANPQPRTAVIRTPDHRLRVFVSSTLKELAEERRTVREAILRFRLAPVMFESGARPHPAQKLYRAYLTQSHIFIGIYWQSYGWVGPGMKVSGLEDEFKLSKNLPALIYIKSPAPDREPTLTALLDKIREGDAVSYKSFSTAEELRELVENDLALLLTERFEIAQGEALVAGEVGKPAPSNVPVPRNPLIGREHELASVSQLLLSDQVALVTLTGPAGTGKSRLGIELALVLRDHFKDGVYLVPLESVRDPALVISTVAVTLGLSEAPGGPSLAQLLKDHLKDRQTLLLLDNFEQVLPAAPRVSELLETCPHLKLLITSRAPLHVRAEKELHVPPLTIPPQAERQDPRLLSGYSAAQLFVQRAQSVNPDFQLTPENTPAVTEILQRLDGLPLAIELASARMRILSPQALLPRLEHRFDLLRGGTRDLPERQRTLYQAIEWSYDLLNEADKRLFRRLSIFSGGWDIEAAEGVCGGEGGEQVFQGLESLLDNSLVILQEGAEPDLRLKMLGTIHEFGLERLQESDEADELAARHARHFLSFAQHADTELNGPAQQVWLKRLETEVANLRAARIWALGKDDAAYLLQLCVALTRFAEVRGYYRQGRNWVEGALAMPGPVPADLRAKGLRAAGLLASQQRDLPSAQSFFEESLALSKELGDEAETATLLNDLGKLAWMQHRLDRATELYDEVLALRRKQDDAGGVASVLTNLGLVAMRTGQLEQAEQHMEEGARLQRGLGNKAALANTLFNLGLVQVRMEANCSRAAASFAESVELARELGYQRVTAYALNNLAMMALSDGEPKQATAQARESLELCRIHEDALGTFYALIVVGHGLLEQGDLAEGRRSFAEALSVLQEIEATSGVTWREELAWLLWGGVHLATALDRTAEAVQLAGAEARLCVEDCLRFPPCAAEYHESILARARSRLAEAEIAAPWAAGEALSRPDTIAQLAGLLQAQS
jgi:predicted ATPase